MAARILVTFILLVVLGTGIVFVVASEPPELDENFIVEERPKQKNLKNGQPWIKEEFVIKPLAEFKLEALVLSKEDYWMDKESELSPTDLALGWGPMSNKKNLDKIDISQGRRWYRWESDNMPIPRKDIEHNSANMHIIPANEEVEDVLDEINDNNVIALEGYLVDIKTSEGWHWVSSLKRTDVGQGACEVVWVEKLSIVR